MEPDDVVIAVGLGSIVGGLALLHIALGLIAYGLVVLAIAYVLRPT